MIKKKKSLDFSANDKNNREARERFVRGAYQNKANIKNLEDFEDGLNRYLGQDTKGQRFQSNFLKADDVLILFESKESQELLAPNLSEEEFKQITTKIQTNEFEVVKVGKARATVVDKEKTYNLKSRPYKVSWQGMERETMYLQKMKNEGKPQREAINSFREKFPNTEVSKSGIKAKYKKLK